ncbi:MAG: hypothetical protein ABR520_03545, partial [Mycobacteriales bacterium]
MSNAAGARASVSTLNYSGRVVANAAITAIDADGNFTLFNAAGTTHVVVDVTFVFRVGPFWHQPQMLFRPVAPRRVLDTRSGVGAPPRP